jgi:hypothetical protein
MATGQVTNHNIKMRFVNPLIHKNKIVIIKFQINNLQNIKCQNNNIKNSKD